VSAQLLCELPNYWAPQLWAVRFSALQ